MHAVEEHSGARTTHYLQVESYPTTVHSLRDVIYQL
jgi:hypothetical protein